jgi:hypothetical protein
MIGAKDNLSGYEVTANDGAQSKSRGRECISKRYKNTK